MDSISEDQQMHKDLSPLQMDIVKAINLGDYGMLIKLGVSGINEENAEEESEHNDIDIEAFQKQVDIRLKQ